MASPQPRVGQILLDLIVPIYLPTLLNAIARGAALVLLPLYALESENGAVVAAAIVGLRAVGTMVSDLPAGQLVAKLGDKAVMLIGLFVIAFMALGAAYSGSAVVLGVVAFGIGVGSGAWILGRLSHITENVQIDKRGRVISVLAGLERAGMMIGPILGGFGAEYFGYSVIFIAICVLTLVACVLILVYATRTPTRTRTQVRIRTWQILIRHANTFLRGGGVMICLSYLRNARQLLIPVWGTLIGLGPAEIGLVFGVSSLFDFLMAYPAGLILDHIGRKAALIPAMTLMSLAMALLPLTQSYFPFLAVAVLAGLGNGFGTGIFMTLGSDFAPRFGRSQFLGIWRLIGDSGGAVGPFTIGAITQAFTITIACVSTGAIGIVGAIVAALAVHETQEK